MARVNPRRPPAAHGTGQAQPTPNMASVARRPLPEQAFSIHEDAATDEVEMEMELADDPEQRTEEVRAPSEDQDQDAVPASDEGEGSVAEESSEDDAPAPSHVLRDMEKLGREVPGIVGKYRLIKRIGEGE
ncbi:hypothetical protein IMZ48_29835 [Candidatus Bathyarchaeota archaeon]|nr:hypothetical protein [Candidatus Bathyarchaeota archaeon]